MPCAPTGETASGRKDDSAINVWRSTPAGMPAVAAASAIIGFVFAGEFVVKIGVSGTECWRGFAAAGCGLSDGRGVKSPVATSPFLSVKSSRKRVQSRRKNRLSLAGCDLTGDVSEATTGAGCGGVNLRFCGARPFPPQIPRMSAHQAAPTPRGRFPRLRRWRVAHAKQRRAERALRRRVKKATETIKPPTTSAATTARTPSLFI